jgi:hypothetical protein
MFRQMKVRNMRQKGPTPRRSRLAVSLPQSETGVVCNRIRQSRCRIMSPMEEITAATGCAHAHPENSKNGELMPRQINHSKAGSAPTA